jgi:hypothetical protein
MVASLAVLRDLCGLRSAPSLTAEQHQALHQELIETLGRCEWFTIGVMAPSAAAALVCLRSLEAQMGWEPLTADPSTPEADALTGSVFLKGNQQSGRFLLRAEAGLGEGVLISGHCAADPGAEDTWGPLPLNFFQEDDG